MSDDFSGTIGGIRKTSDGYSDIYVARPTAIEAVGDVTIIFDNPDEGTLSMSLYGSGDGGGACLIGATAFGFSLK